jgi:hypothetical protein
MSPTYKVLNEWSCAEMSKGVGWRGIGDAGDMRCEAIAAESDEKKLPPIGVVGAIEIEGNRNM